MKKAEWRKEKEMRKLNIDSEVDKMLALKVFMVATGLTAKQLAEKINMKPSTLSRKLNGMYDFKLSEVRNIAEALGLSSEETVHIFLQ